MPFCFFLLANISLAEDQILSHDKKYIGVKDNNIYIYKGMTVAVVEDPKNYPFF